MINPATPQPLDPITQANANQLRGTEGGEYPNIFPIQLPGGQFYIDSTPGKESINIRHNKNGSFIQFDTNGDIHVHSTRDLKVVSEGNTVVKVGQSVKKNSQSDKAVVTVVGDAHLKVENDLHVEVCGNKYETVSKNSFLTVKGTYTVNATNMNVGVTGTYNENAHEKEVTHTFTKNNIGVPDESGVGGELRDVIYGNRVFELVDPRSTFSVISAGNISLCAGVPVPVGDITPGTICMTSANTQTQTVGTNYLQTVGIDSSVNVGGISNTDVGGNYNVKVGGVIAMNAAQIFLN